MLKKHKNSFENINLVETGPDPKQGFIEISNKKSAVSHGTANKAPCSQCSLIQLKFIVQRYLYACSLLDAIQCSPSSSTNDLTTTVRDSYRTFSNILLESIVNCFLRRRCCEVDQKLEIYQRILLRIENVYLDSSVRFDWKYAYGCFGGRAHWIMSAMADCNGKRLRLVLCRRVPF